MENKPRGPFKKETTSTIAISAALVIAFLPSILAVGVFALGGNNPRSELLLAVAVTGIFSSLAAAYVLRQSESGWMLLLGMLLFFVNLAISGFFGLGAYAGAVGSHQ